MRSHKINRNGRTVGYRIGSALGGAALAVAVLASSPAAAATADGFTRVEPERVEPIFFDPFRTFTSCLSAAAHSDSMYPGLDPDEVNSCLEDHGVL